MYLSSVICGTCVYADKTSGEETLLCKKHGQVARNHSCADYQLDLTMPQPPKKRTLDTSRFSKEDFLID